MTHRLAAAPRALALPRPVARLLAGLLVAAPCIAAPVENDVGAAPMPAGLEGTASFLPAGALQYDEDRLPNGLRIISQRVHTAPYISARLVVRTGIDHFPCNDRELPHLVEHLLFSANSGMAEHEIDDAVSDWGGNINAFTYGETTDVVLEAHARYQADALRLLAAMVRDFAPEEADVAREVNVIEHESGVAQTALRLWWSNLPATQTAGTRFSLAAGLACSGGIAPVHHLHANDVRRAFDTYYVPANMLLIVAGDLDDAGLAAAREAFAALPARPVPSLPVVTARMPEQERFSSGWLAGTANLDEPSVFAVMPFRDWEGYYALLLAEDWLNDRLYRDLRSDRGIAYTPSAGINYHGNALSLVLYVETDPADTAETLEYLRALADEVRRDGISETDFERLRRSSLLSMARSFETIVDRADYLAGSVREIDAGGLFQVETFYRELDYARFRQLLARDWPARVVVTDNSPPVSWGARASLLAVSGLLLAGALLLLAWRRFRDVRPG